MTKKTGFTKQPPESFLPTIPEKSPKWKVIIEPPATNEPAAANETEATKYINDVLKRTRTPSTEEFQTFCQLVRESAQTKGNPESSYHPRGH